MPDPLDASDVWAVLLKLAGRDTGPDGPYGAFTPAIRQLHAMSLLDGEVNNGGFSQFFFNGGGEWLDDAIAGLAAAGLPDHRQVTIEAADATIPQIPALRKAREGTSLESYAAWADSSNLGEFDDRWYELGPVYEALDRFVADHAVEIWES
jgi:hypothetical protein